MLFRAFYALPDSIKGADGKPMKRAPRHDQPRAARGRGLRPARRGPLLRADAADYRVELYDGYHADRPEVPDDLAPQFAACEEYFGAFGWTVAIHDTLEADDLLGSYASSRRLPVARRCC